MLARVDQRAADAVGARLELQQGRELRLSARTAMVDHQPARHRAGDLDAEVVLDQVRVPGRCLLGGKEKLDARLARAREGREGALPDLVLLDLDMPKMDGFQTLAAIKTDPRMRRIPVVILTTSRARQDVARALDGHANSYVCKTADFSALEELLAEVRRYWTRANLRPGPILDDAVGA